MKKLLLRATLCVGVLVVVVASLLVVFRDHVMIALMEHEEANRPRAAALPLPELSEEALSRMERHLRDNYRTPEDFILDSFVDHDVVIVGEHHRIRHDARLIRDMIPLLHENGVRILGIEFFPRADQEMIDALVSAPSYDPTVARQVLFDGLVFWGYQEYADLLEAAWALNRSLAPDAPRFRVLGLAPRMDWSHVRDERDKSDPELMKRVFPEGDADGVMAAIVLSTIVEKQEKALVYCGIHHAFTRFHQPATDPATGAVVPSRADRMGNLIHEAIGDRVFMISLHAPWTSREGYGAPMVYPVDGWIDRLMTRMDEEHMRVGFATRGTVFGELRAESSFYSLGTPDFRLQDFCDGYIFQKPFREYRSVTAIPGFIDDQNIEAARRQSPNPRIREVPFRYLGPRALNALITLDSSVESAVAHLQ
jgi:hypothetical protein